MVVKLDKVRRDEREAGYTLLEMLVVIAIIVLLVGFVAPAALRQLAGARRSVAVQSIARIGSVLNLYKLDVGGYPDSQQGLAALVDKPADVSGWAGPYFEQAQVPLDPWKHPFVYRMPSARPGHAYDLCSRGPDDAAAESAMICND